MAKPGNEYKSKYNIDFMIKQVNEYIERNKRGLPILKEVCLENEWDYDYVMQLQREHKELSQATKRLLSLKEIKLEKGALLGKIDKTMAIFSLKQLGWKDRNEHDINMGSGKDELADFLNDKPKKENNAKS